MFARFSPYLHLIALLLVAAIVACAPAAPAADNPALASPSTPFLSVEPGTTKITARWSPVANAASYQIRWRPKGADFAQDALATVADPVATFTVADQGLWVVRVQACDDSGCSRPATATASVIINVSGHQAVRFWHDDAGFQLDWDALPGYYVVKYRTSTDNTKWKTSLPLTKTGYTLTGDDFTDFSREKGIGHPIVRVFFNCNAEGERCALLGRYPNTEMEELAPFEERSGPPSNPYDTGVSGASDSEPRMVPDPLTDVLRPATDFTITTETWGGEDEPRECVARPAENRWERTLFGDVIKKCSGIASVIDTYILDQDAVFPNGAICGERTAQNEEERRDFGGDTVKVCNAHPDEVDQDVPMSHSDVTGATHTSTHTVRWASVRWPARYATEYDTNNMRCKNGNVRNRNTYPVPLRPDYRYTTTITVRWCYHYRSHVDAVQTIGSATTTSVPNAARRTLYGFQFCGWRPGKPDYFPETNNNRYPHEILWHYLHPVARGYLPWGYTSTVTPWYGDVGKIERNRYGVITTQTRTCQSEWFRNPTRIIADWEGRTTLWR